MKNRKWMAAMCLALVLGLGACGQSGEAVNPSATESTSGGEETAPTVTDSVQAASEHETESRQEATEPEEVQIPEEYALAVIVTINPQVKLYLDADNVIVGVEYLNEDAKTAFSDIDFSDVTVEEGMEKIIHAAVEKEFLTDGKDVSIEVSEIRDESCDGEAVCAEAETAAVKAAEENHVTAVVTAKVSAEPTGEQTEGASGEITSEESPSDSEETAVAEVPSESTPETTPEPTPEPTPEAVNICSNCGGTGKCDECLGDGYRGSGYTVSCPRCHGSLTETCIYCDASGNSNKHEGKCDFPNCMGAHVYPCTTCGGGTNAVTCASCNGSGKCKVCGGSGTK